jgi:hypothetical protein
VGLHGRCLLRHHDLLSGRLAVLKPPILNPCDHLPAQCPLVRVNIQAAGVHRGIPRAAGLLLTLMSTIRLTHHLRL